MNAPGKARRERGSLAEYENQVKGELVVGGRRRGRPVGVAVGRLLEWVGLPERETQDTGTGGRSGELPSCLQRAKGAGLRMRG